MVLADLREAYVERVKIRIVLSIIAVFLISMVMSCQELRYMISSKTVDAKLELNIVEKTGRHGEPERKLTWSFDDAGHFRREYRTVPVDWSNDNGQFVKVQYLPGKENQSRLYGDRNLLWVTIFFASLALAAVGIVMIARQK